MTKRKFPVLVTLLVLLIFASLIGNGVSLTNLREVSYLLDESVALNQDQTRRINFYQDQLEKVRIAFRETEQTLREENANLLLERQRLVEERDKALAMVPPSTTTTTSPPKKAEPPAVPTTRPAPKPTVVKPAPKPTVIHPAPQGNPCIAAMSRSRVPLRAGWSESCTSPYYNWGVADSGNRRLFYNSTKIARSGGSTSLWDYVVAHERCHALAAGTPDFGNEKAADRCAQRYGVSTRNSPYS